MIFTVEWFITLFWILSAIFGGYFAFNLFYHQIYRRFINPYESGILTDRTKHFRKEEKFVRDFVKKYIKKNGDTNRYCLKRKEFIKLSELPDFECWKCKEYIGNEGICDPL